MRDTEEEWSGKQLERWFESSEKRPAPGIRIKVILGMDR